jgi:hypothetical protein
MSAALQTQLQLPYRRDTWREIFQKQLFPGVDFFSQTIPVPLTTQRENEIAVSRHQIGVVTVPDENEPPRSRKIAIYEIVVREKVDLPRNRVALRELIARSIDQVSAHAVLAFFVKDGSDEYRLTTLRVKVSSMSRRSESEPAKRRRNVSRSFLARLSLVAPPRNVSASSHQKGIH